MPGPKGRRSKFTGSRSPTSHDVARIAGVSQATVSRALRDDPRITEATRLRVIEAAREVNYVADFVGRSLSQRSTTIVGIASAHLTNPYYPELLDPMIEEFESAGYRTVLLSTRQSDDALYGQLTDGSVDGAVLTSCAMTSDLPARLARRNLPFVLVNRDVIGADADRCLVDNVWGAHELARVLLDLGHRRFAMILGSADASTSSARETGFRETLADEGIVVEPVLVRQGEYSTDFGHEALTDLLATGLPFTAVFCANDVLALGALNAAEERRLRVPKDLTVVGFDDIPISSWQRIQLSTVRQDTEGMGRLGARMLIDRIALPDLERQVRLLRPELVLRSTHGEPSRA